MTNQGHRTAAELFNRAAHMGGMDEKYSQNQILKMLVDHTSWCVEHANPGDAGVDLWQVAAATQDTVMKELAAGTFPMDDRAPEAIRRRWRHAIGEERHARSAWHLDLSGDTMSRARAAVDAVRESGQRVTVEAAHAAGGTLFGPKKRPGRDVIQHILWGLTTLDAPAADDEPAFELPDTREHPGADPADAADELEVARAFIPFMPTPQSYRDLKTLVAARSAHRKDDGGIDCRRLDILWLLRTLTKRYDNGKVVFEFPERTQQKLLGVTKEGLADLCAELDAAIVAARSLAPEYEEALAEARENAAEIKHARV